LMRHIFIKWINLLIFLTQLKEEINLVSLFNI